MRFGGVKAAKMALVCEQSYQKDAGADHWIERKLPETKQQTPLDACCLVIYRYASESLEHDPFLCRTV